MAARKDYYGALGVEKDATADAIKRAYRKLARKVHPDVNPGDAAAEERFKEISEAYHVLGDEKRRKQYDQVGPEAFAQDFDGSDFASQFGSFFRGGFGGRQAGPVSGNADFGMFEEILGGLGGSAYGDQRRRRPRRGRDVRLPLELTLADVAAGIERSVAYRHAGGSERTRVRIPAGVADGATVKVRGKGEPSSSGGPAGDLLLQIKVAPHPHLTRQGSDLRTDVPVTFYEAVLGGNVRVPTLDGSATINLPRGTQAGQVFRLRGRGIGTGNSAGDLLAKVTITAPTAVDDALAEAVAELRDQHPYAARDDG
jgi:molecular chaperone DnaJ